MRVAVSGVKHDTAKHHNIIYIYTVYVFTIISLKSKTSAKKKKAGAVPSNALHMLSRREWRYCSPALHRHMPPSNTPLERSTSGEGTSLKHRSTLPSGTGSAVCGITWDCADVSYMPRRSSFSLYCSACFMFWGRRNTHLELRPNLTPTALEL